MSSVLGAVIVVIVIALVVLIGIAALVTRLFRKVPQGQALVISTMKDVVVTFTGRVVIPVIHKAEVMEISVKNLSIERRGKDGLVCRDNIRADIAVEFFVRVNKNAEDVIKVAQSIGCERASDIDTLRELFQAKFSEALKTAGKEFDFESLYTERELFRDKIIEIIGRDLNGYVLEDVAIDYLEQTPIEQLDPQNILDAEGIRKITERTALQSVATNNAKNDERAELTRKNVDTDKAVLEMERDRAEATARQEREVRTVQAREQAAAAVAEEEERKASESARISTEETVAVAEQNQQREVAVADANRQRVIAVQTEEIERDRLLAEIGRQTAAADAGKQREERRRELAEVARARVEADKAVATEEEAIETVRVVEDASRTKESQILLAEAEAQAGFVATIKAAEADREAAGQQAEQQLVLARADGQAAEIEASAMMRRAEGTKAAEAAPGLATVEVEAARADAIEKVGQAEVNVKLAEADATRKVGEAEGEALKATLAGEGAGLEAKAAGVGAMTEAGRDHEEFRLRLDTEREVALAGVEAHARVAEASAKAVAEGLSSADIDIVSDGDIVDRLLNAASAGQAVDSFVDSSRNGQALLQPYLNGDANLVQDLAAGIGGVGASGLRDLTLAAFLTRAASGDGRLQGILDAVESAGLADTPVAELLASTGGTDVHRS